MVNVKFAVKSQCESVYVLGTTLLYVSISSPVNATFNLEASNLAGGPNSLTAWQQWHKMIHQFGTKFSTHYIPIF